VKTLGNEGMSASCIVLKKVTALQYSEGSSRITYKSLNQMVKGIVSTYEYFEFVKDSKANHEFLFVPDSHFGPVTC